ncbi:hypothetical protein BDV40DRAFT_239500 [Aspergillus tamarii]|uniref:Secreted protein n=1 Tax=Aspergillus tamarii TaxID=41984 RepID=A0A5N6V776_ASPTM|nr:hypothetical protein BDV40DRAFT_239500 [Aspergillus tamarii]
MMRSAVRSRVRACSFCSLLFLSSSSAISSNVGDPTILYHQVIRGLVKQASIVRHLFLSHYPLYVFHGDLALPIGATTHHLDS